MWLVHILALYIEDKRCLYFRPAQRTTCESGRIGLTANQRFGGLRHRPSDAQVSCQARWDGVEQRRTRKYRPSYRPRSSRYTLGSLRPLPRVSALSDRSNLLPDAPRTRFLAFQVRSGSSGTGTTTWARPNTSGLPWLTVYSASEVLCKRPVPGRTRWEVDLSHLRGLANAAR